MTTPQKHLVAKLAEIASKVGWIEKTGHNSFHNYDYVTEADMVAKIRDLLFAQGIIFYPTVERVTTIPLDKGFLATVEVAYFVTDGTDQIAVRVVGSGHDNPGDKAVYKAMTGAEKYALKQLFLIPTGDDPERDAPDRAEPRTVDLAPRGERDRNDGGKGPSTPSKGRTDPGDRKQNPTAPAIKFGPGKGKALSEATEQELAAWTKAMEESVKKNDPKWHKSNLERLEECKAEWNNRQPWRAHWAQVKKIGKEYGLDEEGCQVVLNHIGVNSAEKLTEGAVELFLAQVKGAQAEPEDSNGDIPF